MTINNLYVTYNDDGDPVFHRGDPKDPDNSTTLTKEEWTQQHPFMRRGQANGRNADGGFQRVPGSGEQSGVDPDAEVKAEVRQGVREIRDRTRLEKGRASDGLGQTGK